MLVNIHRSVTATSKPEDYDSFVMPLSHFLTPNALLTAICTMRPLPHMELSPTLMSVGELEKKNWLLSLRLNIML